MRKLPIRTLPALAVAPVLFSSTAVAGFTKEDAGTLLGGEGFGRNELVILAVVMAVAIGVVVYLRWRKSK
ncbi:MAG: hypothetical protein ACO3WK_11750 [Steroidobacteraceae bacterium]